MEDRRDAATRPRLRFSGYRPKETSLQRIGQILQRPTIHLIRHCGSTIFLIKACLQISSMKARLELCVPKKHRKDLY